MRKLSCPLVRGGTRLESLLLVCLKVLGACILAQVQDQQLGGICSIPRVLRGSSFAELG